MLPDVPSFETVFTETRDLLLRQLDNVGAMDTKAGIVAGFDAVIVAASLAVLKDLPDLYKIVKAQTNVPNVFTGTVFLGFIMVLASFILALRSYWVASYREILEPRESLNKWISLPAEETRIKLFHNLVVAYEQNTTSLNRKAQKLNLSLCALLAAVIFHTAAALIVLYSASK